MLLHFQHLFNTICCLLFRTVLIFVIALFNLQLVLFITHTHTHTHTRARARARESNHALSCYILLYIPTWTLLTPWLLRVVIAISTK